MSQPAALDLFLTRIMAIKVLRMGGAAAGIIGASGADSDVVNSLKTTAIALAHEYRQPTKPAQLEALANQVRGFLQVLELTNTLSAAEVDQLFDQLQGLIEPAQPSH